MNLKQLRAFSEVVRTGTLSEAARNLHRSQPAISGLIASLEDELAMKLFTRSGLRLKPAPEALYLLSEAEDILARVNSLQKTMESVRNAETGRLEIASMPGPSIYLLPAVINRYLGERHDIQVRINTKSSPEVEQMVSAQNMEIGVADYELLTRRDESLIDIERFDFNCLVAMRSDDPLAEKEVITPADLHNKPFASLHDHHPTSRAIASAFKAENANLNVRYNAQYFFPLLTFVERKGVYGLIDQLSIEYYLSQNSGDEGKLVFRPFKPNIQLATAILTPTHRSISIVAAGFLDTLRTVFKEIQAQDF